MAGGGIKVNNTTVIGGADGATFIPSVSEDGVISWTNNKGYTNPTPVNIKGKDGETGNVSIVQTTGESTTSVMSQKAVTEAINSAIIAMLNTTDEKIAEAVGAIQTNTITVTENDDGTVDLTIE